MDYGGWYDIDTPEKDFRTTIKVSFVTAMQPTGNVISNRYVRHFNLIYIEPYSDVSLSAICTNIMEWMYRAQGKMPFPDSVVRLKDNIVSGSINVYNEVQRRFRPTPAKSHYTFNLRDLSKVF